MIQPDGYLTEERKAADPDQGFSTFFSETGEHMPIRTLLI
jgi:tubulin alpha